MALKRFFTALALTTSIHSFNVLADDTTVITETLTRYLFTCPCDLATSVSFGTAIPTSPANVINNNGWVDWSGNNTTASVASTAQASSAYGTPSSTIILSAPTPPGGTPGGPSFSSTTSSSQPYGPPGSPGFSSISNGGSSSTTGSATTSQFGGPGSGVSTSSGVVGSNGFPSNTPSAAFTSSSTTSLPVVVGGGGNPNNAFFSSSTSTSGSSVVVTSSTTQNAGIPTSSSTTTTTDNLGGQTTSVMTTSITTTGVGAVVVQTTSSATTSTTTSGTSPGGGQSGTPFVCTANINGRKLRARDILYLSIQNGQAVMVTDSTEAVPLVLTGNGGIAQYSDGDLLGAPEADGEQPFELVDDVDDPALTSDWSIGDDGLQHADVSFCLQSDSSVDVTFGSTDCDGTLINLVPTTDCSDCNLPDSSSTTTTSLSSSSDVVVTTTSSSDSTAPTTTSASAGPDNLDPGQTSTSSLETTTSTGIGYDGSSSTTSGSTDSQSVLTSTSSSSDVDVATTSSTTTGFDNDQAVPTSTTSTSTTDEVSTTSLTSGVTTMTMTITSSGSLSSTTTADTSIPTAGQPFSIQVEVPGGNTKRDILVVGYVNGQLVLIDSPADAVAFVLTPDGVLMIFDTGLVVGFDGGSGTSALVIYSSASAMPTTLIWSVSGGVLVLPGAGFCVGADNVMSVNVGTPTDSSCTPVTAVPDSDPDSYNTAIASTVTPSPQTSTSSTTGSSSTTASLTTVSPTPSGICDPTNNNGCGTSCPYCVQPVDGTAVDSTCGSTAYCSDCNVDADCSVWGVGYTCGSYVTCTTSSGYSGNTCVYSNPSVCAASPLFSTSTTTITSTTVYISTSSSTSVPESSTSISTTTSNSGTSTTTTATATFATDGPNCSIYPLSDQTAPNGAQYTQFFYGCAATIPTTVGSSYTELTMNAPEEDPTSFLARCVSTAEQQGATVWTYSQSATDLSWTCGLWSDLAADTSLIVGDTSVFTMNAMALVGGSISALSSTTTSTTSSILSTTITTTSSSATTTSAAFPCSSDVITVTEGDQWEVIYDYVRLGGAPLLLGSDIDMDSCIDLCYSNGDCNGVELGPDDSGTVYCWGFTTDEDYVPIAYDTWDTALKISGDSARDTVVCNALLSSSTTTTTDTSTSTTSITSTITSLSSTTTAPSSTTTDAGLTPTCTEEMTFCISTIAEVVIGEATCDSTVSGDCTAKAYQYAVLEDAESYVITGDTIYMMNVPVSTIEDYNIICGSDPTYVGIFYDVTCPVSSSSSSTSSSISETSTTTTSDASVPTDTFYVIPNSVVIERMAKRATEYIGFDANGLSIIVDSQDDAALFTIASDGSLILAGPSPTWVAISITDPQQLVLTTSEPSPLLTATVDDDQFLDIPSLGGECILDSNFIVITGGIPADCQIVSLQVLLYSSSVAISSTTTSSATSSTTTPTPTDTTTSTTSTTSVITTSSTPAPTCVNGDIVTDDYEDYTWEVLCGQGSYYGWDHFTAYPDLSQLGDCIVKCDDDENCNAVSIEYRDAPEDNLCGFIYSTTVFQPYPYDTDTAIRIVGPNAIPSIAVSDSTSTTTTSDIGTTTSSTSVTTTTSDIATTTTTTTSTQSASCIPPSPVGDAVASYSTSITFSNFYTNCGESFQGATPGGLENLEKQFAVNWPAPDYSGYDFNSAVQRCVQFGVDNGATVVEFYTDLDDNWFCIGLSDAVADASLFYPDSSVVNVWGFVWENPCGNAPLGALTTSDGTYFNNFYTGCSTSLQGNTPGGLVNLNRVVSVNWLPGADGDYYGWTFDAAVDQCASTTEEQGGTLFEFYTTADGTWYCIAVNDLPADPSSFYPDNTVEKVWGFTITPAPSSCVVSQITNDGTVTTSDGFVYTEFFDGCNVSLQGNTAGGLEGLSSVISYNFLPYDDASYGGWTLDTALAQCIADAATYGASTVEFYEDTSSPPIWYCVGVNNGAASASSFYPDIGVSNLWAFVETAAPGRI